MNPEYSRDRDINVYSARSADPACSLVVGVRDGLVTLSMDMHWFCRPQDVDKLAAALAEAQRLAVQWTERDERIARLMDLRAENAQIWAADLEQLLLRWKGCLLDTRTLDEIRCVVEEFRRAKLVAHRRLYTGIIPQHLRELPCFVVVASDGGVTVEAIWDSTMLRWVE